MKIKTRTPNEKVKITLDRQEFYYLKAALMDAIDADYNKVPAFSEYLKSIKRMHRKMHDFRL